MPSYGRHQATMEHRFLKYTIFLSLLVHALVFIQSPRDKISRKVKAFKQIEITYRSPNAKAKPEAKPISKQPIPQPPRQVELKQTAKFVAAKNPTSDVLVKDASKILKEISSVRKQPAIIQETKAEKRITLSPITTEQISNPLYKNYYQIVRQRIRERAYANWEGETSVGVVRISFMIDASGALKGIKMIGEETPENQGLRNVSLRSVKEAAPFPPFPANLKYPELSFNINISFTFEGDR